MANNELQRKEALAVGEGPGAEGRIAPLLGEYRSYALAKGNAPDSLRTLTSDLRKLCEWLDSKGLRDLSSLGPARLQRFLIWLAKPRGRNNGKPKARFAHPTRQRIVANIRSFLGWAYKAGHLPTNLSPHLPLPRLSKPLPRDIPSLKQIAQLIRTQRAKGTPQGLLNAALVSTLFATGIRRAECASLRINDIEMAERLVRVTLGKGGTGRTTVIAPWAAAVLEEYMRAGRPALVSEASKDWLFLKPDGNPMYPNRVNTIFRDMFAEEKLGPAITPHALRHAFCLNLLKGGASVTVVAALAGHRVGMTARYTPLTNADLAKVVAKAHPRGKRP